MELSNRMKIYESGYDQTLTPNLPIIIRIDGKSFHSWTKGCEKPYDRNLLNLFDKTTRFLIEKTNAVVGYTQSDEINLVLWNYNKPESQVFFNGRTNKLNSVIASMTTAYFNSLASVQFPEKPFAFFDARSFAVPSLEEAVNHLIWREQDAVRNSIQLLAQSLYSQNQLHKKNSSDLHDLLHDKGVNWNDEPSRFRRGGYFKRKLIEHKFTQEELADLPDHHEAHKSPNLLIKRHVIERLELPPLTKIKNRVDVIFYDKEPEVDNSIKLE